MAANHRLAYSIIEYIGEQISSGEVSVEEAESLEVARQCLEQAYHINHEDAAAAEALRVPKPLRQIFQEYLAVEQVPSAAEPVTVLPPEASLSQEDKKRAEELKARGNDLMKSERFKEAMEFYTQAIQIDGRNAVYYCNRAAAYSKLNEHRKAIEDCNIALKIDPHYSKAYGRKGLAHSTLEEHTEAVECYRKAVEFDPSNQSYQNNLDIAEQNLRERQQQRGPAGFNLGGLDFTSMLNNPALMNMASQMMSNPQMQQMMANILSGVQGQEAGPEGISNLLAAGQTLAQQMQSSNPELVEMLRRQTQGAPQGQPQNDTNPDNPDPPGSS
ncbi:small glutamine-rich tetratricopeptide repeat-containing protein alpha-like isoform X2 [Lingula anatina]|uniref:Small glutamine-rich tetratricopeptide repeat-containing protein alpha-like isoform X1 n=1 Tax=Lingula anatina TaxID=7574 RepID=A0A2R2MQB0_LINAN|nr:small glutamine-rich tetratricopeptide repeat-containing protein alpha-like isoform X1 [Lingula anatina]XP_023932435.1 small glutamine-rich tetratricopeptide repeat-containing protein alpha-like isoform X2 [Lingula anatina]|eukprot:XP_023932434.1 small glutamine-rich tetratricopeptide repeat-containing protein alpha-like isoform X1 [Lingula anatina]